MKKKNELNLKELKERLIEVEKQISLIESNRENVEGITSYMGGKPYAMGEVYGFLPNSSELYSHSFSLMMTDADYLEIQLGDLKNERETLQKAIEEAENANGPAGLGG